MDPTHRDGPDTHRGMDPTQRDGPNKEGWTGYRRTDPTQRDEQRDEPDTEGSSHIVESL